MSLADIVPAVLLTRMDKRAVTKASQLERHQEWQRENRVRVNEYLRRWRKGRT